MAAIVERATKTGSVDVAQLAASLEVSGATIRRDLQSLSASHLLFRTHGGAIVGEVGQELSVGIKATRNHVEKRRIGQAAASLVENGSVVGLTGGSTAMEVARALANRRGITVVTNAINIAAELAPRAQITLVVIGGVVVFVVIDSGHGMTQCRGCAQVEASLSQPARAPPRRPRAEF